MTKTWDPVDGVDDAITRYASTAVRSLDAAEEMREKGRLDEHYLRIVQEGHTFTAIAYLLDAHRRGTDPDEAAAMVPTLLRPDGPVRDHAQQLTAPATEHDHDPKDKDKGKDRGSLLGDAVDTVLSFFS
ncbi:hypothetical protein [Nocardiopsis synnemataformans]|uniref:hypothetical protein n=1 Tax=Nocardiopsis synnemataformans TaxID=61305 RepID=UPI003EBA9C96